MLEKDDMLVNAANLSLPSNFSSHLYYRQAVGALTDKVTQEPRTQQDRLVESSTALAVPVAHRYSHERHQ